MKIGNGEKLDEFGVKYPDAVTPLARWEQVVSVAEWKHTADMKAHFKSANVLGQTIFNVGGNKYRLIAKILYTFKTVIVQDVLTHTDYDKGDWKE